MQRLLDFLSISLGVTALASVIWIIVPAPAYNIWLFSVAVSEWSLWLGGVALIAVVCALLALAFYDGNRGLRVISLIIGSLAFFISLYPLLVTFSVARQQNVSLSLRQYFSGIGNKFSPETQTTNFTTYTFARLGETDLKLDVYLPTDAAVGNGASVIVVHGGSWSGGMRNDFPQWNHWLAGKGFTVFDIDYRLAPQPNYLTATGDVKCAIRWVKQHAGEFRIAPDRIVLLGRSAGAHLALLAAYSAGDTRLPASCREMEADETVRAVISLYAPTDLLWAYDNPANQMVIDGPATLSRFLGGSPHESDEMKSRFILASPVNHVTVNTPPTLLIHGGNDQLVKSENMIFLAGKLKESNVPYKTLGIPYAQHGFDYNFNGWGAQVIEPVILDFLHEHTRLGRQVK